MKRFEIVSAAWFAPATATEMTRHATAVDKGDPSEIVRVGYSGVVIRDTQTGRRTFHNVTTADSPVKLLCDKLNAGNVGAMAWFGRTAK